MLKVDDDNKNDDQKKIEQEEAYLAEKEAKEMEE
tara:strand:+ start:474 stop:575 length:102 start_codon:yes stop_codon:yes gene_type:complete